MYENQRPKPKNAKLSRRFLKGQYVWYNRNNKKIVGKITGLKRDTVNIKLQNGKTEEAPKDKLDPLPPFKTGDKILVLSEDQWQRGEILDEDDEGFEVRWKENNKPWHKTVPYWDQGDFMRPT